MPSTRLTRSSSSASAAPTPASDTDPHHRDTSATPSNAQVPKRLKRSHARPAADTTRALVDGTQRPGRRSSAKPTHPDLKDAGAGSGSRETGAEEDNGRSARVRGKHAGRRGRGSAGRTRSSLVRKGTIEDEGKGEKVGSDGDRATIASVSGHVEKDEREQEGIEEPSRVSGANPHPGPTKPPPRATAKYCSSSSDIALVVIPTTMALKKRVRTKMAGEDKEKESPREERDIKKQDEEEGWEEGSDGQEDRVKKKFKREHDNDGPRLSEHDTLEMGEDQCAPMPDVAEELSEGERGTGMSNKEECQAVLVPETTPLGSRMVADADTAYDGATSEAEQSPEERQDCEDEEADEDEEAEEDERDEDEEAEEDERDEEEVRESLRERLERLKARRSESEQANRLALYSEASRQSLSAHSELHASRSLTRALALQAKQTALAAGQDPSRLQWSSYSIQDVETWNERQLEKRERKNEGFGDYNEVARKKYERLVKRLERVEANGKGGLVRRYKMEKERGKGGERWVDAEGAMRELGYGEARASEVRVEAMAKDVAEQIETRHKASRRRAYEPDEDVTYINERNRQFNRKIARAYDKYTQEIRENLERGTAL